MVKLIGAVLILFSASMVGWQIGRYYASRPVQLRALLVGLQMLETEIVYGLTPLQRALHKVGNRLPEEIGRMFKTASDSLRDERAPSVEEALRLAIETHWSQTALRKQERDV